MRYTIEQYKKDVKGLFNSNLGLFERDEHINALFEKVCNDLDVGDGVTYNMYTDSHACTVIKRTKCTLTIQEDEATRVDKNGMSDSQEYTYKRDENGRIHIARWSKKRNCFICDEKAISVGRHEYYDYTY